MFVCAASMLAVRGPQDKLRIVQVGANDGRVNDPIYRIAHRFAARTSLLLIEPQRAVIPYLRENYARHPDIRIENCAVGEGGALTLYTVNEAYWGRLNVPYAKDWPVYRAPTGVTSASRAHVEKWLAKFIDTKPLPPDAITALDVPVRGLPDLVAAWPGTDRIDLLQIDTEGFDDQIIYNLRPQDSPPAAIGFEAMHLPEARLKKVTGFLSECGYVVNRYGGDALAIHARPG
jgi:FkbM family methyltransferase